jgi:hypothetical protein
MSPVSKTDPMMVAWELFAASAEYANAKSWAANPQHLEGSLWALFVAGFSAATERAADLHEQVDPASDMERLDRLPGAGAMGAVIEYRNKIRETRAVNQ